MNGILATIETPTGVSATFSLIEGISIDPLNGAVHINVQFYLSAEAALGKKQPLGNRVYSETDLSKFDFDVVDGESYSWSSVIQMLYVYLKTNTEEYKDGIFI